MTGQTSLSFRQILCCVYQIFNFLDQLFYIVTRSFQLLLMAVQAVPEIKNNSNCICFLCEFG